MDEKAKKRVSKFLSYVLRHHPELIDLELDQYGWANTQELVDKATRGDHILTMDMLIEIAETNDKKRFSFNQDKTMIRANQGHSILNIDLQLKSTEPPEFLYHGTVAKFIDAIKEKGLMKGERQHVHLSSSIDTARKVGSRRGKPIILRIQSKEMFDKDYKFYLSENGVWLTDHVPNQFIDF